MRLLSPGSKLSDRVVHAGFWTISFYASARAFAFIRTLVVARLLAPNDIGLFALASLVLIAVETFTQSGFQSSIINRDGDIESDLNVTWTVHVLRGAIRASIVLLLSPLAARFFEESAIEPISKIIAIATFVNGFTNTGVINFAKHLEFHKESAFSASRILADMAVSITAAVYLENAWALAYGYVAGHVVQVIVSYAIHPFRPRFCLEKRTIATLFRYGVWVNLTGIMIFIANNGASVVVGKMLSTRELGLYHLGYWIEQSALVGVAFVLGMVAFSAYSKIQRQNERLKAAFVRTAGFSISVVIPCAVAIVLSAEILVRLVLGEKWMGMVDSLKLLAAAGCFHAISISGRPVFLGTGRPRILFRMHGIRAAVLLVAIYPLAMFAGIYGAALAVSVSCIAAFVFWWIEMKAILQLTIEDFKQLFGPALIAMSGMIPLLGFASFMLAEYHYAMPEVLKIAALAGAYALCALIYVLILRMIEPRFPTNRPIEVFAILFGKSEDA